MINRFLLLASSLFLLTSFVNAQNNITVSANVTGLNGGSVFLGYIEDAAQKFQAIHTGKATSKIVQEGLKGNVKRIPLQNGKFSTTLSATEADLLLLIFYKGDKESEPQFVLPNAQDLQLDVKIWAWNDTLNAFKTKLYSNSNASFEDILRLEEELPLGVEGDEAQLNWLFENIQSKEPFWAMLLVGGFSEDGFFGEMSINYDSLLAIGEDKPFKKAYEAVWNFKKPTQVGGILPNFQAIDPEGNSFNLSDYRGKYVLLEIWASWCVDCRKEHPHLEKIYHKYKGKDFTVLGISNDDEAEWREAMAMDKQSWKQGYKAEMLNTEDQTIASGEFILSPLERRLNVQAFPTLILLDPEGKIIFRGYEYVLDEIEFQLKSIFGE
jgi:thiol-disulfide isomerase/thioredoxin